MKSEKPASAKFSASVESVIKLKENDAYEKPCQSITGFERKGAVSIGYLLTDMPTLRPKSKRFSLTGYWSTKLESN